MAMIKKANYLGGETKIAIWALNNPTGSGWDIFTPEMRKPLTKLASMQKDKKIDVGGYDIEAAIKKNPENLFVKVFAIKKDEVNANADCFSEEELRKSAHTFIGVPVFCNHQNDDVEKARGKVVHAWYDDEAGGIFTINMVDRVAYPKLARGIEEGYITGTSMGCSVEYSCCSVCHNKAHTAAEYCTHIANRKNRKISESCKCDYHKSPTKPLDKCPVCGRNKDDENPEKRVKEAHVFEHNIGIKFIEDSFVVDPACRSCLVHEILNTSEIQKKIASAYETITKFASSNCEDGSCLLTDRVQTHSNRFEHIEKFAGKQELDILSQAMDGIEHVAKAMMAQKNQVSMEYVSDLVKTLADVQAVADELTEMGYAQLPSPPITAVDNSSLPKSGEDALSLVKNQQQPQGPAQQVPAQQVPQQQAPQGGGGSENADLGGIGTITKPKISASSTRKKEEFLRNAANLMERIGALEDKIASHFTDITDKSAENSNLQESQIMATKNSSQESSMEKVAKHDTSVTTEKQLDNAKFTGERTSPEGNRIIEKMIDNDPDANVTTSASPQKREGDYHKEITQKQLESVTSGYVVRWGDYPDKTTEGQWTEMSREIGSKLSRDQSNIITEKQLADFLSKHRYVPADVITQKQLSDQNGDLSRWAYSYDPNRLIKAAMEVVSDTIAYFSKTPQEVSKAASAINENVQARDKAAMIVLVNSLPTKKEARKAEKDRYRYFSKLASVQTPETIDALVVSMADHVSDMSADDLIHAVKHVASSPKAMAKVEALVKTKLSSSPSSEPVMDKSAQLDAALIGLNKEADGTYQVEAPLDHIKADVKNKKEFVLAAKKYASQKVAEDVGATLNLELTNLHVNEESKFVVATVKEVSALTAAEKKALANLDLNELLNPSHHSDPHHQHSNGTALVIDGIEDGGQGNNPLLDHVDEVVNGLECDLNDKGSHADPLAHDKGDEEKDCCGNPGQPMATPAPAKPMTAAPAPVMASSKLESRASSREQLVKKAQALGGEMGGQGGASQAPGAGASLPQPPAGGQQPGVESFEDSSLGEDMEGEGKDDDLQAKPPGAICPVCGSEDVDIIKGQGKCNNCASEFRFEVEVKVTKWTGLLEDKGDGKDGEKEDVAGEGFEMPKGEDGTDAGAAAATPPPAQPAAGGPAAGGGAMPAAASVSNDRVVKTAGKIEGFSILTKITPESIKKTQEMNKKLASIKDNKEELKKLTAPVVDGGYGHVNLRAIANVAKNGVKIASISPITGSANTLDLGEGRHVCLDTGVGYKVDFRVDAKNPKNIYAKWSWNPKLITAECTSCKRSRKAFAKALSAKGLTESQFEALNWKDKANKIVELHTAGAFKAMKTASVKDGGIIAELKKIAGGDLGDKFPTEQCREVISRRFGENAVALSGPYEGQKLSDAIIKSFKKAGVYSDDLVVKVAEIWGDLPACEDCIKDFIREGFEYRQASAICHGLDAKYAQVDDMVANELGQASHGDVPPSDPTSGPDGGGDMPPAHDGGGLDSELDSAFPADDNQDAGSVGGDDLVGLLQKALDVAKGGDAGAVDAAPADPAAPPPADPAAAPVAEGPVDEKGMPMPAAAPAAPMAPAAPAAKPMSAAPVAPAAPVDPLEQRIQQLEQKLNGGNSSNNGENSDGGSDDETPENKGNNGDSEKNDDNSENSSDKKEGNPFDSKNNDNNESDEGTSFKSDEEKSMDDGDFDTREASVMNKGHIASHGEINMDLSKVLAVLNRQNKSANKTSVETAQDAAKSNGAADWGKGKIGNEEAFDAKKPEVYSGPATMGGESKDLQKAEKADVYTGDARIDGEKDNDALKSEHTDKVTGGEFGTGGEERVSTASSTKDRIQALADRITANLNKKAEETVTRKQVQDDEDTKPYSGGDKFIGNEKESIGDVPAAEVVPSHAKDVVRGKAQQFIGNEKEAIGDVAGDAKIPGGGDARIGGEKDNDKIKSEKTNEMTGNSSNNSSVTASSGSESAAKKTASFEKATELAGRLLQAGKIQVDQLAPTIAKYASFDAKALAEIESAMLTPRKGLSAPADGYEQAVIISEASNNRSANDELKNKLSGMFRLAHRNQEAEETTEMLNGKSSKTYHNRLGR